MEEVDALYCLTTGLNLIPGQFDPRCVIFGLEGLYDKILMLVTVLYEMLSIVGLVYCLVCVYKWMFPAEKKVKYKKKHVFITGGTSGLGLALAKLFAKRGAHVTMTGRDQERLDKAVAEVSAVAKYESQKIGGSIMNFEAHASLNQSSSVDPVQVAQKERGGVDILICCAALHHTSPFGSLSQIRARNIMDVNYWGTFEAISKVLPGMKKKGSGHIVAISSHCAVRNFEGYSAIAPTKMAVRGLMETLHAEYSETDLKFQLYHPIPMKTKGREKEQLTKPQMTKDHESILYEDEEEPEEVAEHLVSTMKTERFYTTNGSGLFWMEIAGQSTGWTTCGINKIVIFLTRQLASWIHLFLDTSKGAWRKAVKEATKEKKGKKK